MDEQTFKKTYAKFAIQWLYLGLVLGRSSARGTSISGYNTMITDQLVL